MMKANEFLAKTRKEKVLQLGNAKNALVDLERMCATKRDEIADVQGEIDSIDAALVVLTPQ